MSLVMEEMESVPGLSYIRAFSKSIIDSSRSAENTQLSASFTDLLNLSDIVPHNSTHS